MAKVFVVQLSQSEHELLEGMLKKGKLSARKLKRAQILLATDTGQTDERIAQTLGVHVHTIERTRKRFVLGGLEKALNEDHRPGGKVKLDGKGEAVLVALACSDPPSGHSVWTMQLLADRLVALDLTDLVAAHQRFDTVDRALDPFGVREAHGAGHGVVFRPAAGEKGGLAVAVQVGAQHRVETVR